MKAAKNDLYRRSSKPAVKGGEALGRAYLTVDGDCVPASAISNLKLDPEGSSVEMEMCYTTARFAMLCRCCSKKRLRLRSGRWSLFDLVVYKGKFFHFVVDTVSFF